jgi:hypothetical protein
VLTLDGTAEVLAHGASLPTAAVSVESPSHAAINFSKRLRRAAMSAGVEYGIMTKASRSARLNLLQSPMLSLMPHKSSFNRMIIGMRRKG